MNPKFRTMRQSDIDEVEAMDLMIFGTTIGKTAFEIELKSNPLSHYFVLEDEAEGSIIGHVGLWIDEKNAQILNFYVKTEHQGKGFGRYMIERALNYLSAQDCENLTLEVRPSNVRAVKLYENFGFTKVAVREKYYENGEDAYLMLKKL